MSQPPQGEDPWAQGQGGRPPASGWGPPSGGWGPPPGGPYAQPGRYGPPGQYARPGSYGAPSQYGSPGRYGDSYGQPGPYGGQPPSSPYGYGQQPAWGEPGWAPAQPPHKPRRSLATLVFLAVIIGGVLVYVLTTGVTRLDPDAVERDVSAQYEQREGVSLDLSCDQDMNVRSGRTYECAGRTGEGEDVTITIEVVSADGEYTWSDR